MNNAKLKMYNVLKILVSRLRKVLNSPTNANMPQVKLIECWVLQTEISPSGIKDIILPMYINLVRSHLEFVVQFGLLTTQWI